MKVCTTAKYTVSALKSSKLNHFSFELIITLKYYEKCFGLVGFRPSPVSKALKLETYPLP